MSEETNENVLDQLNDQQEVVSPESSESQQAERQEEAPQSHKRNDAEYNWAETRRVMKEQERRLMQAEEELNRIRQQAHKVPEEDSLEKLADDDLTTVAHAKKIAARVAREAAEAALRQRDYDTVDERLQAKYSDFDQIVSQENIEFLKQNEPELAYSLKALASDPYAQGVAAYKLIKKVLPGTNKNVSVDKRKAETNLQKPISVNAAPKATTPLGNAHMFENGLTAELKAQLWKEMQEAKKMG